MTAPGPVPIESLARCPAFAGLPVDALHALAAEATCTDRAAGLTVLPAGSGGSLHLLLDGCLRIDGVADDSGESDRRIDPGTVFPIAALLAHRGVSSDYVAIEPSRIASWPADTFDRLHREAPTFRAWCTTELERAERDAIERLRAAQARPTDGLLATPLADVVGRAAVTATPDEPVRVALERMRDERVGSVVVVDDGQRPLAIVTLRDVLERVALPRSDLDAPVSTVATPIRWTAPAHAPALHAAMLMARHGVRHIPVTRDERLVGLVSEGRLYALQAGGLRQVAATIRAADGPDGLRDAGRRIRELAASLAEQGSDPIELTRVVSGLTDAVTARAIALARAAHPPPAVRWCWIALGSEGREEQTLATDQDNGLVFEPPAGADVESLAAAFVPFAAEVNRLLDAAGYPLCRGGVMAGNPQWCLSLAAWRARFADWITHAQPHALLNAAIFFDFRAVDGDASLAATLRVWLVDAVGDDTRFLFLMTRNALDNGPPLGVIRDFVLAGGGEHPGTLDLKVNGVQPFVEAARILALAHGVAAVGTVERLRGAARAMGVAELECDGWVEAFRFLQRVRLELNARQWRAGSPTHNHLDPATLNGLDRRMLKESFRQARRLQMRVARDHGGGVAGLGRG